MTAPQAQHNRAEDHSFDRAALLLLPLKRFMFLRWFAACAVLVAPVALHFGLRLPLPLRVTTAIAACLAAINAAYYLTLRRMEMRGWANGIRWMEPLQAFVDLVILSVLLFATGGVRNPLLMFYVFHVIITGILFEPFICFSIAISSILLVAAEYTAETRWPDLCPNVFGLGPIAVSGHFNYIACILAAFAVTLLVTAHLACAIAGRLRREQRRFAAATERLEKLEAAKSRLLHFISHEVMSPLAAATTCLRAACATLERHEDTPEAASDMLERADLRLAQMVALVGELAQFLQQQSEAATARLDQIDLKQLVEAVLEDQQCAAKKKNIDVAWSSCEGALYVSAHAGSLRKAIGILVGNAIQYTAETGHVSVSLTREQEVAQIAIADSGIGIPEAELEDIFREFYRSPNARKASRIGTGLGLAIVKTTIENHRGKITVASTIGQGSTFTVRLPQAPPNGDVGFASPTL